jgi:hypothetical protein
VLPLAVLLAELAAGVRTEEVARIEPVRRDRATEERRKLTGEIRDVRAAPMPEGPAIGHRLESEHLLHAAVAVGRHDEDDSVRDSNDDVVVELALLPVVEELVAAVPRAKLLEERSEDEVISQRLHVDRHLRSV